MSSTKRISRRELREDPLANTYAQSQDYLSHHWRLILVGALILITAVVAILVITRSRATAEREASGFFRRAQQGALVGDFPSALELSSTVIDRYGSTKSGRRASLVKADALAGLGNLTEARTAYEEAMSKLSGDEILSTSARRGLAVLLENSADYAGAAAIYKSLAADAQPEGGRVFDLRAGARCYQELGQDDKSIALLQEIVTRYEGREDRVHRDQVHLAKVMIAEIEYRTAQ